VRRERCETRASVVSSVAAYDPGAPSASPFGRLAVGSIGNGSAGIL
jgi:hypothetical protein